MPRLPRAPRPDGAAEPRPVKLLHIGAALALTLAAATLLAGGLLAGGLAWIGLPSTLTLDTGNLLEIIKISLAVVGGIGGAVALVVAYRSQLYAEPQRLVTLGLVSATQEEIGRRRRTFAVTDTGREELVRWLGEPAEASQHRDPAMLKLFFMDAAPELIEPLARRRVEELSGTLRFLEQPGLGGVQPSHLRVLTWGRATVRANLAFWRSVLDDLGGER
ncbi:PadR family transcriptional regulator (plasmid) [Microtetraspora malaysiensis]|uniref:PadR family transcriptional regulator n=1 Tax=Microtetraspora malaysiensis TaxID=161358 RepID=UPI003D946D13